MEERILRRRGDGRKPTTQEKWRELVEDIKETAKELGLTARRGKGEDWQSRSIKEQKKKMWVALKRWLKEKREEDKMTFKGERKKLKELIKKETREKKEESQKRVEKSKNINEFWKEIKQFRRKKKKGGELKRKSGMNTS